MDHYHFFAHQNATCVGSLASTLPFQVTRSEYHIKLAMWLDTANGNADQGHAFLTVQLGGVGAMVVSCGIQMLTEVQTVNRENRARSSRDLTII